MQMHMDTAAVWVNPPAAGTRRRDDAGLRVQNSENNPMQRRREAAGTLKSDLTRRATQRYFSIIPKLCRLPAPRDGGRGR
ncbi:hypothetical protein ACVW17_005895 [Bradyrhizobium sp. USDA 4473]